MKALTLHQPWAHAITHLGKRIENRTWRPPASFLGQTIAIHAGKKIDRDVAEDWGLSPEKIPAGCVVAVATLAAIVARKQDLPADQRLWWNGPIGWLFTEVMPIEPVPCRGAQGLWELPPEIERAVSAAVMVGKPWGEQL